MVTAILRRYQGDMSQREFARLLGLSTATFSLIFSGQRKPGIDVIAAFLRVYPNAAEEIGRAQLADALAAPEREMAEVAS